MEKIFLAILVFYFYLSAGRYGARKPETNDEGYDLITIIICHFILGSLALYFLGWG